MTLSRRRLWYIELWNTPPGNVYIWDAVYCAILLVLMWAASTLRKLCWNLTNDWLNPRKLSRWNSNVQEICELEKTISWSDWPVCIYVFTGGVLIQFERPASHVLPLYVWQTSNGGFYLSVQNMANCVPSLEIASEPAVVLLLANAKRSVSILYLKLTAPSGNWWPSTAQYSIMPAGALSAEKLPLTPNSWNWEREINYHKGAIKT